MDVSSSHNQKIDHLKAFAIIMVVFYHALFQADICYTSILNICITIALRNVHVPLFILVAGYLCHRQNIRNYLRKKALRILIPFLFFTVLKLLANNLLDTEYLHANTLSGQLWDAFLCGQLYWFCYCLLILYLVAPLFWNRKWAQWIIFLAVLAANCLLIYKEISLTDVAQLQNVLYYSPYFFLGMLLQGKNAHAGKAVMIYGISAAALLAVTGYLRFFLDIGDRFYIIDYVFGISVMYLLYLLSGLTVRNRITQRIFSPLGKYSLQIMLLDPFWRMAAYALSQLVVPTGMLLAVLVCVLDLALSIASCRLFERVPGLSFLTGLKQLKAN